MFFGSSKSNGDEETVASGHSKSEIHQRNIFIKESIFGFIHSNDLKPFTMYK
jgi:hypothetical protein